MSALPLSVVIISLNAEATIGRALRSAQQLSTDIIVVDSGSTDATPMLVQQAGARLMQAHWEGFGANKNKGNEAAQHDWILSLDADEELSHELITAIRQLNLSEAGRAYKVQRLNYLNGQPIYHGAWSNDWITRLFNRKQAYWDDAPVHEGLVMPPTMPVKKLPGLLHHYTAPDLAFYNRKLERYASLMAEKYLAQGEKGAGLKVYLSPLFNFLKYYLIKRGWLDKKAGWQIAMAHARYTFKKYKTLQRLIKKTGR